MMFPNLQVWVGRQFCLLSYIRKEDYLMKLLPWLRQLQSLSPILCLIYLPCLVILAIAGLQKRVSTYHLLGDTAAIAKLPFYFGAISNIGVLLWCVAAAICLFTALALRQVPGYQVWSLFCLCSGLLTAMLLLDDLFQLHEAVYPKVLGIPQKLTYLGYAVLTALYLVSFRKRIFQTEFVLLAIALSWFGISILLDMRAVPLPNALMDGNVRSLLENGAQLLGIISWTTYCVRACLTLVRQASQATSWAAIADSSRPLLEPFITTEPAQDRNL